MRKQLEDFVGSGRIANAILLILIGMAIGGIVFGLAQR